MIRFPSIKIVETTYLILHAYRIWHIKVKRFTVHIHVAITAIGNTTDRFLLLRHNQFVHSVHLEFG